MLGLEHGVNRLADYDPAWPAEFEREKARIESALGKVARGIEHYGSTAVAGLRAKPIIDILLGVAPLDDWAKCRQPLERIGYDYAENAGVPGHFIFGRGRDRSERTHLVHIVEFGGASWRSSLAFRDALRTDDSLRAAYLAVKENAAALAPQGRASYNELKHSFIEGFDLATDTDDRFRGRTMWWDERYAVEEYVYGTEPNAFLAEHASELSSPVLSLAEGEGRNAVYLASLGLEVHGVDGSRVGLDKAQALAKKKGVEIRTEVANLSDYTPEANYFGSVVSIFAHLPSKVRHRLYPLVEKCLKPGGIVLLEAYSEAQSARDTGGPKDLDMLMSIDKIRQEFPNLEALHLEEREREVREGIYHTGAAVVIQFIGRRKG